MRRLRRPSPEVIARQAQGLIGKDEPAQGYDRDRRRRVPGIGFIPRTQYLPLGQRAGNPQHEQRQRLDPQQPLQPLHGLALRVLEAEPEPMRLERAERLRSFSR